MEIILLAMLAGFAAWQYKVRDQRQRIALLGRLLGRYQIEKHMETLTQGYSRALGGGDAQAWSAFRPTEQELCTQCTSLCADMAAAPATETRVSLFPFYLPMATRLLGEASFDLRRAIALHTQGICRAVRREGDPRDRAFVMLAELLLMQHTCHWFCRSRAVASARMLARHRTSYEQLLAAVSPETRAAYGKLVGRMERPAG
jgi:hypothetical protein